MGRKEFLHDGKGKEPLIAALDLKTGRRKARGKASGIGAKELMLHMMPGREHKRDDSHALGVEALRGLGRDRRVRHGEHERVRASEPDKRRAQGRKRIETLGHGTGAHALRPRLPVSNKEDRGAGSPRMPLVKRDCERVHIGLACKQRLAHQRSLTAHGAHALRQVEQGPAARQEPRLHGNAPAARRARAPEHVLENRSRLAPALERADDRRTRVGKLAGARINSPLDRPMRRQDRTRSTRTGRPVGSKDHGRGIARLGQAASTCRPVEPSLHACVLSIARNALRMKLGSASSMLKACIDAVRPHSPARAHGRYRASTISSGTRLTCLSLST